MQKVKFVGDEQIGSIKFPDVGMRHIAHVVRNIRPIQGYRAVVDRENNHTYAIVKDGYQLIDHRQVLRSIDEICAAFPEYGTPKKEVWLQNAGGRMKTRWTFTGIDFEIKPGDVVHPTLETFSSYDTTLAQRLTIGGYRLVCTNGMVVGKTLAEYKRKHTASLDLDRAKLVLEQGMKEYSKAAELWTSYAQRNALAREFNAFEVIGFNKTEQMSIETEIKRQGNILKWDDEDPNERKVEINAWDLMNIYTAEIEHRITDIQRRTKLLDNLATTFVH